jgi:hypothetical protein
MGSRDLVRLCAVVGSSPLGRALIRRLCGQGGGPAEDDANG